VSTLTRRRNHPRISLLPRIKRSSLVCLYVRMSYVCMAWHGGLLCVARPVRVQKEGEEAAASSYPSSAAHTYTHTDAGAHTEFTDSFAHSRPGRQAGRLTHTHTHTQRITCRSQGMVSTDRQPDRQALARLPLHQTSPLSTQSVDGDRVQPRTHSSRARNRGRGGEGEGPRKAHRHRQAGRHKRAGQNRHLPSTCTRPQRERERVSQ